MFQYIDICSERECRINILSTVNLKHFVHDILQNTQIVRNDGSIKECMEINLLLIASTTLPLIAMDRKGILVPVPHFSTDNRKP